MGEIQIKNIDGVVIFRHTAKNNSVKITLEEAMELAFYRGSTIDQYSKEQGSMAAVGLTEEQLHPYLQKYDKLVIACYNSPNALTVSGDTHQIDMLCSELKLDGLFCRRLVVTHAFHSPYMNSAMPAYQQSISYIQGDFLNCFFLLKCLFIIF